MESEILMFRNSFQIFLLLTMRLNEVQLMLFIVSEIPTVP